MPLPAIIYVRGERRDVLTLDGPKLDDMDSIEVTYDFAQQQLRYGPHVYASDDDYGDGAYRLRPSKYSAAPPGRYRVNGVVVRYRNGARSRAPLSDDIEIEIEAAVAPPGPPLDFAAR